MEILGHDRHAAFLRDRRFSQDHSMVAAAAGITDPEVWRFRTSFLTSTIGRDHARLRAVVAPFFGKAYLERLREPIRAMLRDLVSSLPADRPVDLFAEVCNRLPAQTYAELVRAPLTDEAFITRTSDSILQIFKRDPALAPIVEGAYPALFDYIDGQFARCREDPGDDMVSQLVSAVEQDRITHQEALDLAVLMLEASTDNTAHQMALVLAVLLEDRSRWQRLVAAPELIPAAVEESIRLRPRTLVNDRVALDDLEWSGFEVPKGTRFTLSTVSAHRDATAYPDPDRFDLDRDGPPPIVMFGGGITTCLGANLARLEIQEFVRILVERFPGVRLAGDADWRMDLYRAECSTLPVLL